MNLLWAELDRKMELLMDGKSWLMFSPSLPAGPSLAAIMGKRFWFTDVSVGRISAWGGANYDHTVFGPAVAAGTDTVTPPVALSNPDHTHKIRFLDIASVDLDNSIEAHKRDTTNAEGGTEPYWVWQNNHVMPEKQYRYAVAELVYEHAATTEHSIPKEWDKYNYFRIHNLNGYAITVEFEAENGAIDGVTVPRWGCQCVQRRPGGRIETAYKYFWKAKEDDPRVLALSTFNAGAPVESMLANNVVNFAIGYRIVAMFSDCDENTGAGFFGNVRWIRDPHEFYDVFPSHREFFGDPAEDETLLGDILHHKGEIVYLHKDIAGSQVRSVGEFTGYRNLAAMAAATGLTVVNDASGVTIEGTTGDEYNDVVTPGTNLLYEEDGTVRTAVEVDTAVPIEFSQPAGGNSATQGFWPLLKETTAVSHTYEVYTLNAANTPVFDHNESVGYDEERLVNMQPDVTTELKPWQETVATALTFNTFGMASLVADDQDSDVSTLKNRRIALTAFGPLILWEQAITFNASVQAGLAVGEIRAFFEKTGPHVGPYAYIEEGKLVQHRFLKWPGYGWAEYPRFDGTTYNGSTGGFVSPRRQRAVNENILMQNVFSPLAHCNITMPIWNVDGADFEIQLQEKIQREIRTLFTPELVSPDNGHWPVWQNVDWLNEFVTTGVDELGYQTIRASMLSSAPPASIMPRVKLLVEHYNTLAAWINSIHKARPYSWRDVELTVTATMEAAFAVPITHDVWDRSISNGASPGTGNVGIFSTTVRPKEQYAGFALDSFLYRIFDQLGVPLRTSADFPEGWADLTGTHRDFFELSGSYNHVVVSVTDLGGGNYEVFWREELTGLSAAVATDSEDWKLDALNAATALDSWPAPGGYETDTNPASPTYKQLVLSDYYWVKIADVKAKAESLGFKFIYEETSVPCQLEGFTSSGVSNVVGHGETKSFVQGSDPGGPGTVLSSHNFGVDGVEDSLRGHTVLSAQKDFPFWAVSSETPEWKRDIGFFLTIADIVPGDVLTFVAPMGLGGSADFINQAVLTEECRKNFRGMWKAPHNYVHKLLYTCVVSSGITKANKAIKIPTPWITHPVPNFSEVAEVNARARIVDLDSMPLEVVGAFGPPEISAITGDYGLIEPDDGEAAEVLVWQDAYVDCT